MSAPGTFDYTSQALPLIAKALGAEKKPLVLDFGPGLGSNISFFSAFSAKLYIEDLYSIIAEDFATAFPPLLEKISSFAGKQRFDLILFWDLLHYLPPAEFEALLTYLAPVVKPSSQLLVMQYTAKKIPNTPSRFAIESADRVALHKTSSEEREPYAYTQTQLKRLLPGLQSQRSVLLRNGMQEVLFSFEQ